MQIVSKFHIVATRPKCYNLSRHYKVGLKPFVKTERTKKDETTHDDLRGGGRLDERLIRPRLAEATAAGCKDTSVAFWGDRIV